jgi:RND family efflux transporter MFP subunit
MAEPDPQPKPKPRPNRAGAIIRPLVLLFLVGGIAFLIWRNTHRSEGYTGGDVITTGTIDAVHVQLSFKVAGRLADVPVLEGQVVQPGQLVARLETADLDVALSTARATLEAARAARAQATANHDQTARDLARQVELVKSGATAQQQLDMARAAAEVAVAQVAAAEAQIHQAESALQQASLQRSYAELKAEEAGVVSEKVHQPGEMVMVGTPVVTLAQVDTVKVHAAVDETRVGAVRPGDRVRVRVYTFDKRWFDGEVTDIQPAGEFATRKDWGAQRRDIRTFTVTARVPNPDHLLKDGMTAEVTILVSPAVKVMAKSAP